MMLNAAELERFLAALPSAAVLVVGDFFLDKYLVIDPAKDEPSLETGLTAYQVVARRCAPGAAGTVTNNLRALGVGEVIALGVIGDDGEGLELRRALAQTGVNTDHLIISPERVTPTYTKPVRAEAGGEREINRLDIKNWSITPPAIEDQIIASVRKLSARAAAVIVLDQVLEADCGVVTSRVRAALAELGRSRPELPIIADSRGYGMHFTDVMVKCNQHEVLRYVGAVAQSSAAPAGPTSAPEVAAVKAAAQTLTERTHRPVFVTMGERGQLVAGRDGIQQVPAIRVTGPIDPVGAGDATTAGIISGLVAGASLLQAAALGNLVASITIQKLGTTGTASPEEVRQRWREKAAEWQHYT